MEVVNTSPGPLDVHLWLQCGSMDQWSILDSHVFMITWLTEEQVRMSKSLITARETKWSPGDHHYLLTSDPSWRDGRWPTRGSPCLLSSEWAERNKNQPFLTLCPSSCLPLLKVWWWPRAQARGSAFTTKERTFALYVSTTHWTNIRAQRWRPAVVYQLSSQSRGQRCFSNTSPP